MADQAAKQASGAIHFKATGDDLKFAALIKGKKPVLVDFYADWCGPCKMAAPIIEKLAVALAQDIIVAKVDVDVLPGLSSQFGVMSIPTVITMVDGKETAREIGFVGEAKYSQMMHKAIELSKKSKAAD